MRRGKAVIFSRCKSYLANVALASSNRSSSGGNPDFVGAEAFDRIIDHYNNQRLHSALSFLRPIDYYRGNPEALLAKRRRKLQMARELRKQENLNLRQRLIPWPKEAKTVA